MGPLMFESAGLLIGGLLCAGVLLQLSLVVLTSARRAVTDSHQRKLDLQLLRAQIESARKKQVQTGEAGKAWEGFRKFEVSKKFIEAKDMCSFYLSPHDKKKLPGFKPGQYLTFKLEIPGQTKNTIRCYSLSAGPREDFYRVTIKKVAAPKDKPEWAPGLSSSHFHGNIKEGDILDVKAPHGEFFLDMNQNKPAVLIGGGIGITPVLSMLEAIVKSGVKRETWFFLGVANGVEHPFKEQLQTIAREHDNIHVQICYSKPGEKDVADKDYHHPSRVSVELFKKVLPSSNYDYYLCGPGPFMESIVGDLEKWGVPTEQIHFEAFGPASVKAKAPAAAAAPVAGAPTVEIHFKKAGKTLPWDGVSSLLEFAEANGIRMDSGCRAGSCGTCLTAVKGGKVKYSKTPSVTPEAGSCLTCLGLPDPAGGQLILDA
jgi:ferredoxin-NADP reductase